MIDLTKAKPGDEFETREGCVVIFETCEGDRYRLVYKNGTTSRTGIKSDGSAYRDRYGVSLLSRDFDLVTCLSKKQGFVYNKRVARE